MVKNILSLQFWYSRLVRRPHASLVEMPETSISIFREADHPYARIVEDAFAAAQAMTNKLPRSVLEMDGMSGKKYRRLINEIIMNIPHPRYLEVGSYKGSTACAALFGNQASATLIDHWEQFGGREEFSKNIESITTDKTDITVIESDFRRIDAQQLGKFNIYLFDGPHEEADQRDGIVQMFPALDSNFILIVDDWNWEEVRNGTAWAISELGLRCGWSLEVRTTHDGSYPPVDQKRSDWHNGYFIGCMTKS